MPQKNLPSRPRIIFMGTPDFSVPSLEALVEHGHKVLAVITQPDRPRGRGKKLVSSPVKLTAIKHGIKVLQPDRVSDKDFCDKILRESPDLFVVVAFGQILKKRLLEIPSWGCLNIHASLLPKYRGAAPIQRAIMNNETITGLTAMRIEEGLDTGPVISQEEAPISRDETFGALHDRLSIISGDFLIKTLRGHAENRLNEKPQNNSLATYARKIDKSMSLIKWDQPAKKISAIIRALDPWPGAFTTLNGKVIKLFSSSVLIENCNDVKPGRVHGHNEERLLVETGKGIIEIRELQAEGRKRLPASDFLRGFPIDNGALFESSKQCPNN
ncbi:MAG: methionyl-tRNA formyltransferase [Desulfobacteraceae bacterium 4484_190.1]|nr:MAG: methionyl-tRNA formyltransferase [Desulfobacteraceae bacterium 4484_190.1]